MRTFVWMCIAAFVLTVTVAAQGSPPSQPEQDDRIIVGTDLVTVNVIVTDSSGHYVKGLSRDQFTIHDNKAKQQIAHLQLDLRMRRTSRKAVLLISDGHDTNSSRSYNKLRDRLRTLDVQTLSSHIGKVIRRAVTNDFRLHEGASTRPRGSSPLIMRITGAPESQPISPVCSSSTATPEAYSR